MQIVKPVLWLMILISALPRLSENTYAPALPSITKALTVSESLAKYTISIYLLSFAFGILFWGKVSDFYGRKPCFLVGLLFFIAGCLGCSLSSSIESLMFFRVIEAFGCSVANVLSQAVCRDCFRGAELGKAYSLISSGLAIFGAIGPILGGFIVQKFGYKITFIPLLIFAIIAWISILKFLPETHIKKGIKVPFLPVLIRMIKSYRVISFAILVALCRAITFGYYAEGSFYLIDLLSMTPSKYGATFIAMAFATMLGGIISRKLHDFQSTQKILYLGIKIILIGSTFFLASILFFSHIGASQIIFIIMTVVSMMIMMIGTCIVNANCLSLALQDYTDVTGTASSIFGFFYYIMISISTFSISYLHQHNLFLMPSYFLAIAILMLLVFKLLVSKNQLS